MKTNPNAGKSGIFTVLLALVAVLAMSVAAMAAPFDTAAFKKNITNRVKVQFLPPAMADRFDESKVTVEAVEKAGTVGGVDFYAVKMVLGTVEESQQPQTVYLIVDETGSIETPALTNVASGINLTGEAMAKISAVTLEDNVGSVIMSGTGSKDLLVVSDPLCPYCKRAWKVLKSGLGDNARNVRLVHFPLSFHAGSDAACLAMFWAENNDGVAIKDAVDFAYDGMTPAKIKAKNPRSLSPEEKDAAGADIIGQFLKKFPAMAESLGNDPVKALSTLRSEYGDSLNEDMDVVRELQVQGTPTFFVLDGGKATKVEQFTPDNIKGMLK